MSSLRFIIVKPLRNCFFLSNRPYLSKWISKGYFWYCILFEQTWFRKWTYNFDPTYIHILLPDHCFDCQIDVCKTCKKFFQNRHDFELCTDKACLMLKHFINYWFSTDNLLPFLFKNRIFLSVMNNFDKMSRAWL